MNAEEFTKNEVLTKRKEFFDNIVAILSKEPVPIDRLLNQEKYYVSPNKNKTVLDEETGDLAIFINSDFFGKDFSICYTFWQYGETFKIGITIQTPELAMAIPRDVKNEIYTLWHINTDNKTNPNFETVDNINFAKWEFNCKNLLSSYLIQENFIIGIRHMHFRIMRMIYDECKRLTN